MEPWVGVLISGTAVGYALVSRWLASALVTPPIVFLAVGLGIGPVGLDLLSLQHDAGPILTLLELTLVLVLFTDALMVRPAELRRDDFLPVRLLVIGFPLTMALGWLVAWPLLPGLSIWELALVAIVLGPTDGALGLAAISNPGVPAVVREGLNVESGLNDGMALPFFVLALAAAVETSEGGQGPLEVFLRALVLSAVIGGVVGWSSGRLLLAVKTKGWIDDTWRQLSLVAIALLAYTFAVALEGSGFIAAWVAGLAFGAAVRGRTRAEEHVVRQSAEFAESLSTLLTAVSFLVFGAALLGPALQHLSWHVLAYSLLSLTVIRMLPVLVALAGSRLKAPTVAYVGWFGPRGLASIVLGLLVAETAAPGVALVGDVVALTVGISVLAHGASAGPLASRYARWYRTASRQVADLRESTAAGTDNSKDRASGYVPGVEAAGTRPLRTASTSRRWSRSF